jgi:hypothetical protein
MKFGSFFRIYLYRGSVPIDACLPFAEHLDSLRHASSEQSFQFAVNEALDLSDFYQHQDKSEVEETDFSADLFSPSFRNGAATAQFTSSAVAPSNPVLLGTRILIRRVDLLHAKLRRAFPPVFFNPLCHRSHCVLDRVQRMPIALVRSHKCQSTR